VDDLALLNFSCHEPKAAHRQIEITQQTRYPSHHEQRKRNRLGKLTLVLFEKDNICGFVNPMHGKVLNVAGTEISITHDSNIPYESGGD